MLSMLCLGRLCGKLTHAAPRPPRALSCPYSGDIMWGSRDALLPARLSLPAGGSHGLQVDLTAAPSRSCGMLTSCGGKERSEERDMSGRGRALLLHAEGRKLQVAQSLGRAVRWQCERAFRCQLCHGV